MLLAMVLALVNGVARWAPSEVVIGHRGSIGMRMLWALVGRLGRWFRTSVRLVDLGLDGLDSSWPWRSLKLSDVSLDLGEPGWSRLDLDLDSWRAWLVSSWMWMWTLVFWI